MSDQLYDLLPALHRERDIAEGEPLRALLAIAGAQLDHLQADILGLWDDFFVETCQPWVVPYLGDLVGAEPLFDRSRIVDRDLAGELFDDLVARDLRPAVAIRNRADVARTIGHRRRKGTLAMLEELARDVTGWPAHAVELFDLLGRTQHLGAPHSGGGWADLRSVERTTRMHGPFDEAAHTVDVRRPGQHEGLYNVPNVGIFLWRLGAYPLEGVPARRADLPWRWHCSPLGNRTPLFTAWRREGDAAGLATELHVAGPMRPALLHADLASARATGASFSELYGDFGDAAPGVPVAPGRSVFIMRNGSPVPLSQVRCARLDPWPSRVPHGRVVAVDPVTGRVALGDGLDLTTTLDVSFHQGFAADIGGGPYERGRWLVRPDLHPLRYAVRATGGPGATHTSLATALADWETPSVGGRADAVISILDSRTYELPAAIRLPAAGRLVIEAANGQRPLLRGDEAGQQAFEVQADGGGAGEPEGRAELTLSGVVLEGFLRVTGDLGRLRLLHSTLVPGHRFGPDALPDSDEPSITVQGIRSGRPINDELRLEIAGSITGPLDVPSHADRLVLVDAIVDGLGGAALEAPRLVAERATVLGPARVREVEASNSIFTDVVEAARTQAGCVRFSYVPPGSTVPAHHRCQPHTAAEEALAAALTASPGLGGAARAALRARAQARVRPAFTDLHYGSPAYGQLRLSVRPEIATGAEDGSEMGAFCAVKQAQREGNLRTRLAEHLPLGLEAGIVYVS